MTNQVLYDALHHAENLEKQGKIDERTCWEFLRAVDQILIELEKRES